MNEMLMIDFKALVVVTSWV